MTRRQRSAGQMLIWAVLVSGLAVLYLVEWRSGRTEIAAISSRLIDGAAASERRAQVRHIEVQAGLRNLGERLSEAEKVITAAEREIASLELPLSGDAPPEDMTAGEAAPVETEEELPALPPEVDPERLFKDFDLKSVLEDPTFNPGNVELTLNDKLRAVAIAKAARGRMEMLDGELELAYAEAMDELRETDDFVELGRGEAPEPIRGVIAVAEAISGGGQRLFYLFPEEFPHIYENRDSRKKTTIEAAHELLRLFER